MATILHVDMDAFFAAVEVRLDPALRGQPVVVGGTGRRGVVAAASYEARMFGVRSAMPVSQARRLCPHAIVVPGRYDVYQEVSAEIHRVFQAFTPLVEGIALDEAFLDVTGAVALFGDGPAVAGAIRDRIQAEVGLTASVGVAATKFVAKLASEAAKPVARRTGVTPGLGVVVVAPGDELAFLHPHPVEALWGVGPVTASRLLRLGITTIGQLAQVPVDTLERTIGSANGRHLYELAWGRDPRPVEPERAVQSIGHEETYPWDREDRTELEREVVRLSESVAGRLRAAGVTGRTVTIKVRFGDFTTITRSRTVPAGIDTSPAIARTARALLEPVDVGRGVRLLGVSVANLSPGAAEQLALPLDRAPAGGGPGRDQLQESVLPTGAEDLVSWRAATHAVDLVRARYGDRAVGPAVLLDGDGLRLKRAGDTQWGPSEPRQTGGEGDPGGSK